jgi:hypothetical protein
VDNVYLSGDFNLVLNGASSSNRVQSFYENKLANLISAELETLRIEHLSDISQCTWNRGLGVVSSQHWTMCLVPNLLLMENVALKQSGL